MATHDYIISNASGAAVRADLNNALAAIVSNNSNATSPATTYAYQWWADTTTGQLKLRNSSNSAWITIFELDGTMLMEDGTVSAPGLAFASDLNTGFFRSAADKINFATGGAERLEIGSSEVVFNDPSNDVDFRVESNGNSHMLFVDAGNDRVGIGTSSPQRAFVVSDAGDEGFEFFPGSSDTGNTLNHYDRGSSAFIDITTNADQHIFGRADGEKMRIDSSGRLLVAATSSTANSAADDLQIGAPTDSGDRGITVASSAAGSIRFADDGNDSAGYIFYSHSDNSLRFGANGSERIRIDSSGNVAIGTSTIGSASLTLYGSGSRTMYQGSSTGTGDGNGFTIGNNGSTDGFLWNYENGFMQFATNNTERARIDSSGRLLVGASSSADQNAKIQASTTAYEVFEGFNYSNDAVGSIIRFAKSRNTSIGSQTIVQDDDELGRIAFLGSDGSNYRNAAKIAAEIDGTPGSSDMPGRLVFATSADGASTPTERVRIDSEGRVQFGTTSQTPHTLTSGSGAIFSNLQTLLIGKDAVNAIFNRHTSNGEIIRFNRQGVDVGSIDVTTTSTSYNTSSDHRLKENVVDLGGAIDRVKQLAPKRFNFIADADTTVDGFLAHEAQTVVPEAVTGTHNEVDGDDNPVYQGIDQSKLVPLLTAALQEAIAKIETLETKVAALEAV